MGDISIIARRLEDGHVQYGWSGNGGYYSVVGARLQEWYDSSKEVEYLFRLGETGLIGRPGSEHGGFSFLNSHGLTGRPFDLGTTEREIFSKIAFIDYGYFYDIDKKWYYVIPGPFRIKIPLKFVANNLNDDGYEFDFLKHIDREIIRYIFDDYYNANINFQEYLSEYNIEEIKEQMQNIDRPIYVLFTSYRKIFDYFDDWIVICSDEEFQNITSIMMRVKSESHVETIEWS